MLFSGSSCNTDGVLTCLHLKLHKDEPWLTLFWVQKCCGVWGNVFTRINNSKHKSKTKYFQAGLCSSLSLSSRFFLERAFIFELCFAHCSPLLQKEKHDLITATICSDDGECSSNVLRLRLIVLVEDYGCSNALKQITKYERSSDVLLKKEMHHMSNWSRNRNQKQVCSWQRNRV